MKSKKMYTLWLAADADADADCLDYRTPRYRVLYPLTGMISTPPPLTNKASDKGALSDVRVIAMSNLVAELGARSRAV